MTRLHPFLICLLLLSCMTVMFPLTPCWADETEEDPVLVHNEVPDDPYIASPRADHPRSPAMRYTRDSFFAVQVNVDALGQNIVGDAANEPSIAVDPTDPNKMVIGWRQFDTISSNFRQAGYGYTTNGGLTWIFPGVIEPGIFRSDPVLDSDSAGNLYYNSLTLDDGDYLCEVFRSPEAGMPWDSGTPAHGGDKQWMVIDKSGSVGDGHIYANWNSYFSSCLPGFFTRSTDGGDYYENCTQIPDEPYWGTLTVDPDGRLFSIGTYGSDFVVGRSSNAKDSGQSVVWDLSTVVDLGGSIESFGGPNPGGLLGQACIATIPDPGPEGMAVCVLCSADPSGGDPLDVKFARSTDGGLTWSPPVRVNDDVGNAWQWFGTMSASLSGRIDAIWLDTRDNLGTYLSSLYYSYSEDGGVTWSENERLSGAFDPHVGWPNQDKMGDYFHMVSDNSGFSLAWAATFNGEQDVYFARKNLGNTAVDDDPEAATPDEEIPSAGLRLAVHPNPFNPQTTITFSLERDEWATVSVFELTGKRVAVLADRTFSAGDHSLLWNGRDGLSRAMPSGTYVVRLETESAVQAQKLMLLR